MASDIWLRTILILRKETRCRHIGYYYRLTSRVLLYAPSHRQDNTYHGLCYTSRGTLDGTRNSSMDYIHTYLDACIHTYIYTYIDACMHTNVHTYIHTYIQTIHRCSHTSIHTFSEDQKLIFHSFKSLLMKNNKIYMPEVKRSICQRNEH